MKKIIQKITGIIALSAGLINCALAFANSVKLGTFWTWDFGFDYNTKCGLIIGMSGIGLTLGYDFIKLVIKA